MYVYTLYVKIHGSFIVVIGCDDNSRFIFGLVFGHHDNQTCGGFGSNYGLNCGCVRGFGSRRD